jgi:hypothetical protein
MEYIKYIDVKDLSVSELIDLSIKKWTDIRDGIGSDRGIYNCALCAYFRSYSYCKTLKFKDVNIIEIFKYLTKEEVSDTNAKLAFDYYTQTENPLCFGCPVRNKTGVLGCQKTPYTQYKAHELYSATCVIKQFDYCEECAELAGEMIKFLKSLDI